MASNPLQQEFNKEYKRVQQIVRRGVQQGYEFDKNLMPKRIHNPSEEDVQAIKNITSTDLYTHATFTTPTGEVISGTTQRQFVRQQGTVKAVQTRQQKVNKITTPKSMSVPTISAEDKQIMEQLNTSVEQAEAQTTSELAEQTTVIEEQELNNITDTERELITERTRKNNTTFESEYFKYLNERDTWADKFAEQYDYPEILIEDVVRRELQRIESDGLEKPARYYYALNYPQQTGVLISLLDDLTNGYNVDINEARNYLLEHQQELFEKIEFIIYGSGDENDFRNAFAEIGLILNGGEALTFAQASALEETIEKNSPF